MDRRLLASYAHTILLRNTELRLGNVQLEAEVERLKQQSATWEQTAIAAIAKAEAMERR